MARKTASPKSSGGGGYTFEERVAAWWSLHLLAGSSPLDSNLAGPTEIRLQAKVDDWLLDDFVARFPTRSGYVRAAVSVKSNSPVTAFSAPQDFVKDCWEQLLRPGSTQFRPDHDFLVLATANIPATTLRAIQDAVTKAASAPKPFDRRIMERGWCPEGVRKFARSFARPRELGRRYPKAERRIGVLLQAVRIQSYDFEDPGSESEKRALSLCRGLVESGSQAEARLLWKSIIDLVKELRPTSGVLTLQTLLDQARTVVRLRSHPDYATDWLLLGKVADNWGNDTKDTIGKDIRLRRRKLLAELVEGLKGSSVVVVTGESGIGKSVLVKRLGGETDFTSRPPYYLDAHEIAHASEPDGINLLTHALPDLLGTQQEPRAVLVIDRVDRLSAPEDFRPVARCIRALRLDQARSPWRLVLTCERTAWDRVRSGLTEAAADLGPYISIRVEGLEEEELHSIGRLIPAVARLALRKSLRPVLGKPKILDLIALATAERTPLGDTSQWVGEPSLVDWFWRKLICGGGRSEEHGRLLIQLAQGQADNRTAATPTTDLSTPDTQLLSELARVGVIFVRDETIRFRHDLYADYAKQRYLMGQWNSHRAEELRIRQTNPLWYRAIRLLALDLLEPSTGQPNLEDWKLLLQTFAGGPEASTGADLVLESVFFAMEPDLLLEKLLPDLRANEHVLFKRLLVRFFYATTERHPLLQGTASGVSPALIAELDARFRIPILSLWLPVVKWLTERRSDILSAVSNQFIPIAEAWLSTSRQFQALPLRTEIAETILALAEKEALADNNPFSRTVGDLQRLYMLALMCGVQYRERLKPLLLRLCGRVAGPETSTVREIRSDSFGGLHIRSTDQPEPWPNGPISEPDDDFQKFALTAVGAELLVENDVELAEQIFFSLLIEVAKAPDPFGRDRWFDRNCGLQDVDSAYPPLYDFAPAERLLSRKPEIGLHFVTTLIEFATDRWADDFRAATGEEEGGNNSVLPGLKLEIDGESRFYVGDSHMFQWNRGSWGPHVATANLMALEHWLYTQAEQDRLDGTIDYLLRNCKSVAILGVLFDLALKHPNLLFGPLEVLIQSPAFYIWAPEKNMNNQLSSAMISWTGEPGPRRDQSREWHSMSHRQLDFRNYVVPQLWISRGFKWPALEKARQSWLLEASPDKASPWITALIEWLNQDNWAPFTSEDGRSGFQYVEPEERRQEAELFRQKNEEEMRRLSLPIVCSQILEGTQQISEDQFAELLSFVSEFRDPDDRQETIENRPWSSRCGVAAVGVTRFEEWLETRPEWQKKCREWLVSTVASPPKSMSYDSKRAIGEYYWDSFCAEAIPRLWAAAPDDPELRRAVGNLVGAPHEASIARLFRVLAAYRQSHSVDFMRLLHLAVWSARFEVLKHLCEPENREKAEIAVATRFERKVAGFSERRLMPLPADWPKIAGARPQGLPIFSRKKCADIDWADTLSESDLHRAVSWMFGEASNVAVADRQTLIGLVNNLAQFTLSRAARDAARVIAREMHDAGTPSEPDYETAALNAAYVVHESNTSVRHRLWKPWVELPPEAAAWTGVFLEAIYGQGVYRKGEAPNFLTAILEIFECALGEKGFLRGDRGFRLAEVAWALLGFERYGWLSNRLEAIWVAEREPLARALSPYWQKWAELTLPWFGCAHRFLTLLSTPAAKSVRMDALSWLANSDFERWMREHGVRDALVSLLEQIWTEQSTNLSASLEARRCFDLLINGLVRNQVPRAIVLSEKMNQP